MTRGIHLKHLKASDLGLLGLPEDLLRADSAAVLAAETDPALSRITREVRETLEEALALLDQALAIGQGADLP
jgi:hypothetical protein